MAQAHVTNTMIESPCIKVCVIDQNTGLCEGCGRSLQQIAQWGALTSQERRKIMHEIEARKDNANTAKKQAR